MVKGSRLFTSLAAIGVLLSVVSAHNLMAAQKFAGTWVNPYPQGNTLNDVWGASGTDVFAVGDMGTIVHYDGTTWRLMASGTEAGLQGVWGTSGNNVFAVGEGGTILHYDGQTWAAMDSPTSADLAAVWAATPSAVFAVGSSGTILHYDGLSWSAMDVSDLYDQFEDTDFLSVWGLSAEEVYVGGLFGQVYVFNGSSWAIQGDVDGEAIYFWVEGIWGTASDDLWVVGWESLGGGPQIHHYDGSSWRRAPTGTTEPLYTVWGAGPEVFVVGGGGTILHR